MANYIIPFYPKAAPASEPSTLSSTITQFGITWTFDQPKEVGQFANGDWYVVGPVNITDISPNTVVSSYDGSARVVHGSMLDPITDGFQGYDSFLYYPYIADVERPYQPSLNVASGVSVGSPLYLSGVRSLISTISRPSILTDPVTGRMSQLDTAAILTVVSSVPPSGSFRPAYGRVKRYWFNESTIDYNKLLSLPIITTGPASVLHISSLEATMERPWIDHVSAWYGRFIHPIVNMPDYGREIAAEMGSIALSLHLDYTNAQKRKCLLNLIQYGIDTYGLFSDGCIFPPLGGQGTGRKFPILFAGYMLNDSTMSSIGSFSSYYTGVEGDFSHSFFSEDGQTFFVEETSPGVYNHGVGNYVASDVGLPEWGNNHSHSLGLDNSDWLADAYRSCCTINACDGFTLAARMLGLRTAWNHEPLFQYIDRYKPWARTTYGDYDYRTTWINWVGVVYDAYDSSY